MVTPVLFLLAAVTLREDTVLRSGCDADDLAVVPVKAGDTVQVRFALAGSSTPCYKVSTAAGTGYVFANQLDGLEQFVRERNRAPLNTGSIQMSRAEVETLQQKVAPMRGIEGPAGVVELLNANQPAAALAKLEPVLRRAPSDVNLLTLAGVAAWRSDDAPRALAYWKTALEQKPDDSMLKRLCAQASRETAGDRSGQRTIGMRVTLRYEGAAVAPEVARDMLNALDLEYARISGQLGCRAEERITAIVQSREAYLKTTGAAVWSGGQYDGRIHIALLDSERGVGPQTRRLFAHELVHACLASLGTWPSWFHEGMAQKLSGDHLSPAQLEFIGEQVRARALPRLENLGRDWSGLTPGRAQAAYGLSLRAADLMMDEYAGYGLRNILNNRAKFEEITTNLDKRLGL